MVLLWFSHDFPTIFLAMACFLRGFRKDPISPPFSQSFRRPWTPSGPPWDPYGTPLGSPWAHLGPPWTPQTTPWAHPGRPLADPRGPDRKTLEKGLAGPDLPEPFWHPKSCFFCYTFSPVAFMHFKGLGLHFRSHFHCFLEVFLATCLQSVKSGGPFANAVNSGWGEGQAPRKQTQKE